MPKRLAGSFAGFLTDATASGAVSGHRSSARRNRRRSDFRLEKKRPLGQRVLDGRSGVRAGGRLKTVLGDSETVSLEMSMSNAAMIP